MDKQMLDLKGDGTMTATEARATVGRILIASGFTVRQAVIQKKNSKTKITVLEYWEDKKEN